MTQHLAALAPDARRAGVLAAGLIATGLLVAMLLAPVGGAGLADWIGLTPRHGDGADLRAWAIFANNITVAFSISVATATAAAATHAAAASLSRFARAVPLIVRCAIDCTVAALVALNVALVSVAVAAFPAHALRGLWLHGPVETFGFCVALSLYLAARRGQLTMNRALLAAPVCVGVLAVAALLETAPVS